MFNELFFTEFRMIPVKMTRENFNDEDMVRAITDNENLTSLGYTLKPMDIVQLAKTDVSIYETVKKYVDKVDADPMYPDFPTQVMEMDEATFRFHQLVHYFSTYGMESLFGVEIKQGWLPDVQKTDKTKKQDILLPAKTLSLIVEEEKYSYAIKHLLGKRERLTLPEKEILAFAVRKVSPKEIAKTPVAFKENLLDLFVLFFDAKEDAALRAICQHTGDVLTCLRYLLTKHHYKLTTSERKRSVRLLESYPAVDFRTNLILSNKKAQNSFIVLDYLSYNKFSRSVEHKMAVKDFRDGKLHSWESGLKQMLSNKEDGVVEYAGQHPGVLLRMVAWFLRLGYDKEEICQVLSKKADSLSIQTLLSVLNKFSSEDFQMERSEAMDVLFVMQRILKERLTFLDTPLKGKKVFIEEGIYDFESSTIETNEKSEEGGYIRSGLVFNIPKSIENLRFFVYWNDTNDRVDVDLHTYALGMDDSRIHVGWNSDFNSHGIVHSGDITHSDAAEYIDINMSEPKVKLVETDISYYNGDDFSKIDTCFTGMMAVSNIGKDVELYDPANCFFFHNLRSHQKTLQYALIDVVNRKLKVLGKPGEHLYNPEFPNFYDGFSLKEYCMLLLDAQKAVLVSDKEDADLVVRLDKGADISLIDENYFMDC